MVRTQKSLGFHVLTSILMLNHVFWVEMNQTLWVQIFSQAMDKSLNTLTPLCDFVARINNEGHEPTLVAFETVDTKGNWRVISDRFARSPGWNCVPFLGQSERWFSVEVGKCNHGFIFLWESNCGFLKPNSFGFVCCFAVVHVRAKHIHWTLAGPIMIPVRFRNPSQPRGFPFWTQGSLSWSLSIQRHLSCRSPWMPWPKSSRWRRSSAQVFSSLLQSTSTYPGTHMLSCPFPSTQAVQLGSTHAAPWPKVLLSIFRGVIAWMIISRFWAIWSCMAALPFSARAVFVLFWLWPLGTAPVGSNLASPSPCSSPASRHSDSKKLWAHTSWSRERWSFVGWDREKTSMAWKGIARMVPLPISWMNAVFSPSLWCRADEVPDFDRWFFRPHDLKTCYLKTRVAWYPTSQKYQTWCSGAYHQPLSWCPIDGSPGGGRMSGCQRQPPQHQRKVESTEWWFPLRKHIQIAKIVAH